MIKNTRKYVSDRLQTTVCDRKCKLRFCYFFFARVGTMALPDAFELMLLWRQLWTMRPSTLYLQYFVNERRDHDAR